MERGDVVLANILFTDRTGSKKRPAVVVSTDRNNSAIDDVILAAIPSFTRPGAFTHVFVDPATPDGRTSALLYPSYVQCENLFVLDKKLVNKTLGKMSDPIVRQIDARLKLALELP